MALIAHESLGSCSNRRFCNGSIRHERSAILSDLHAINPGLCGNLFCPILRTPLDVFDRADSVSSVYESIDDGCHDVSLEVLLGLQFGILLQSSF